MPAVASVSRGPVVDPPPSARDVVRGAIADDGRSLRQLARDAETAGLQLSADTLSRYLIGRSSSLRPASLMALHVLLNIPMESLRRGGDDTTGTPLVLPERAALLTARERALVLDVVDTLLAAHGVGE